MGHVQVLDLGRSVRALFAPLFRYLTFFFSRTFFVRPFAHVYGEANV